MIYVLMGPSASGKDTILKEVLDRAEVGEVEISELPMITTRPMREGEMQLNPYLFVDDNGFKNKRRRIIEHRKYNTALGVWKYGTMIPKDYSIDKDYITIAPLDGYQQMCQFFKKRNDGTVVIPMFIHVEDETRLLRSIKRKGNLVEICRRFIADSDDFSEERIKEIAPEIFYNDNFLPTDDIIAFINSAHGKSSENLA